MSAVASKVTLLRFTPAPAELVATSARVCYSDAPIADIESQVQDGEGWVEKLMTMGHESPVEHAVFTFGIEGVSRSLLAQITRHRIASFSVRSQRYIGETSGGDGENTFAYVVPHLLHDGGPCSVEDALAVLGSAGGHGALDWPEGAVWRVERREKVDFLAKYVRPDKVVGYYLPEVSGRQEVWNWRP